MLVDTLASSSRAATSAVVVGAGDPDATRTVYATVVVLAVLGLVLAGLAVWVFRRTRPDPELLSPLETMATRRWRKLDPAAQRRSLDDARPPSATPLRREASEPELDSSFATVAPVASFDDLSEELTDLDTTDAVEIEIDDDDERSDDGEETLESERVEHRRGGTVETDQT